MPKYLVDSNVFIQAKNMYYRFDFCAGFWQWMQQAHSGNMLYSIKKVMTELSHKPDEAKSWAQAMPKSFFLEDVNDAAVMVEYGRIMNWAVGSQFSQNAIAEFSKATTADAFLIAVAKVHGHVIVTQEQSNPKAKKKIFLPDAAMANGVETMYVYDMLSAHSLPIFAPKP